MAEPPGQFDRKRVERDGVHEAYVYDPQQVYRYLFSRRWDDGPTVCWVGLNPGTGDTDGKPRSTLRRMMTWSIDWGMGALTIVNLFAYRSTSPSAMRAASATQDIVGPSNDDWIEHVSESANRTIAAWGAHGHLLRRGQQVIELLDNPLCLGLTKHGHPRHPLYVPASTALRVCA